MGAKKWERIDKSDIQLITQSGFVAINHRWHVKAQCIFKGVRIMRPESEVPSIGFCMNLIAQNKFEEALQLLEGEERYFMQNGSPYHFILRSIIFRMMENYAQAHRQLTQPNVDWGDYHKLVEVLLEDLSTKMPSSS